MSKLTTTYHGGLPQYLSLSILPWGRAEGQREKDESHPMQPRGFRPFYLRGPRCTGVVRAAAPDAVPVLQIDRLMVVDFGTAVTFDVVTKNKEISWRNDYPRLEFLWKRLPNARHCFPRAKLEVPGGLIGRDTKNSMLSGIVYGLPGSRGRFTAG